MADLGLATNIRNGERMMPRNPAVGHSPALLRFFADCVACMRSALWSVGRELETVVLAAIIVPFNRRDVLPRNRPGHPTSDGSKAAIGRDRFNFAVSAFFEGIGTRICDRDMDFRLPVYWRRFCRIR